MAAAERVEWVANVEHAMADGAFVDSVERYDIDLVVMETNGRRGINRLAPGVVTERVVRTGPPPVLAVQGL